MDPVVVVPWAPGCRHREAAWAWVQARYIEHGYEVVTGTPPDGPWCKAAAVADALTRTDAELLVVADADCWVPHLAPALDAVRGGAPWAVPHLTVRRLTPESTQAVLRGAECTEDLPLTQKPYNGYPGGGVTILTRTTYEDCPLDPRFTGWGQEDASWALALRCLVGPEWRTEDAPLWHLWHPEPLRESRIYGNPAGKALHRRYKHAQNNPALMAELVEEAKCRSKTSSSAPS